MISSKSRLNKATADNNPFDLFKKWFDDAVQANLSPSRIMSLATVNLDGSPSVRGMLLHKFSEEGFVFLQIIKALKHLS